MGMEAQSGYRISGIYSLLSLARSVTSRESPSYRPTVTPTAIISIRSMTSSAQPSRPLYSPLCTSSVQQIDTCAGCP